MSRVSKYYNQKQVLKDINLSYYYGAKIGVLGLNGSGKSSLLRILAQVDENFQGQAILSKGYTVGLLEQEPQLDADKTVREIVQEGCQKVVALLKEWEEVNAKFETATDFDALLARQAKLQDELDASNAWDLTVA